MPKKKEKNRSSKIVIPHTIYVCIDGEKFVLRTGEKWEIGEELNHEKKIMPLRLKNIITGG